MVLIHVARIVLLMGNPFFNFNVNWIICAVLSTDTMANAVLFFLCVILAQTNANTKDNANIINYIK